MSAIEKIGQALPYDAVESILASGGSFALALHFAAVAAEALPLGEDSAPESRPTERVDHG